MKTLSKENARELLGAESPDAFLGRLTTQVQLVEGTYSAPTESGVQIALSRLFAYLLFEHSPVCLYVTGWGIATEHFELFEGYRRSLGENRPLIDSPIHLFKRGDEDAFISILCIVFFFSWDASIFDLAGRLLIQTSHDGWLAVRAESTQLAKEVSDELATYGAYPWKDRPS